MPSAARGLGLLAAAPRVAKSYAKLPPKRLPRAKTIPKRDPELIAASLHLNSESTSA
jgi:hypothetical protein